MARNRTHTCTFFDDGDLDLVCACGTRSAYLVDEDVPDGALAVLLDEDTPLDIALVEPRELAVSA